MKKLETLTSDQKLLITIVRQEWLDLFFKNKGELNKPLFEQQIEYLGQYPGQYLGQYRGQPNQDQ